MTSTAAAVTTDVEFLEGDEGGGGGDDKNKWEEGGEEEVDSTEASLLVDGSHCSPVNSRQDYRLDFTEVEGNLEEIPEEVTAAMASTTTTTTMAKDGGTSSGGGVATTEVTSINVVNPASAAPAAATTPAQFHIPESNASDVAYSECSYQPSAADHQSNNFFRGTGEQPLTAKQQVALWLTRTSMSDLSSMPSLRSLVFPRSSTARQSQGGHHHHHQSREKSKVKSGRRGGNSKAEIHRNFSTKSLINGYGSANRSDDVMSPSPIRKCETVIALSAGSETGTSAAGISSRHQMQTRSKRSSLNLFKRLARRGGGGKAQQQQVHQHLSTGLRTPHGAMSFSESGCESPFRVRGRSHVLIVKRAISSSFAHIFSRPP